MSIEARDDERIDETLEETFPASDPPANTVETGIALNVEPGPPDEGPSTQPDRPERS